MFAMMDRSLRFRGRHGVAPARRAPGPGRGLCPGARLGLSLGLGFGLSLGLGLALLAPLPAAAQFYYRRQPEALLPQDVGEIAVYDLGLRRHRVVRSGPVYYVDGQTAAGVQMRYVIDAYDGDILGRQLLSRQFLPPPLAIPDDDRDWPRRHGRPGWLEDDEVPESRALIRPGQRLGEERKTGERKAGERKAGGPAAPPKSAAVSPPLPPTRDLPAVRPAPSGNPGAAALAPAAPKLRLQNPEDLRLPGEPDRAPPLASHSAGAALAPAPLDDATPKSSLPPTPAVPVAPLD